MTPSTGKRTWRGAAREAGDVPEAEAVAEGEGVVDAGGILDPGGAGAEGDEGGLAEGGEPLVAPDLAGVLGEAHVHGDRDGAVGVLDDAAAGGLVEVASVFGVGEREAGPAHRPGEVVLEDVVDPEEVAIGFLEGDARQAGAELGEDDGLDELVLEDDGVGDELVLAGEFRVLLEVGEPGLRGGLADGILDRLDADGDFGRLGSRRGGAGEGRGEEQAEDQVRRASHRSASWHIPDGMRLRHGIIVHFRMRGTGNQAGGAGAGGAAGLPWHGRLAVA